MGKRRLRRAAVLTITIASFVAIAGLVVPVGSNTDHVLAAPPATTTLPDPVPVAVTPTTAPAGPPIEGSPATSAVPAPDRPAQRVASPVPDVKIRPTSLPARQLVILVAVAIVSLAIAGFVYGKVRSRVPSPPKASPLRQAAGDPPNPEVPPAPAAPGSPTPASAKPGHPSGARPLPPPPGPLSLPRPAPLPPPIDSPPAP